MAWWDGEFCGESLQTWGREQEPDSLPSFQLRMGSLALLPAHSHGMNEIMPVTAFLTYKLSRTSNQGSRKAPA